MRKLIATTTLVLAAATIPAVAASAEDTPSNGPYVPGQLLVRFDALEDFEVARKPEKVQVKIHRDDTATLKGRYLMTVEVPPGTSAGEVVGQIVLTTDHPEVSELAIPVNIFVSRSWAG